MIKCDAIGIGKRKGTRSAGRKRKGQGKDRSSKLEKACMQKADTNPN